jgi:hypothetical protein|tara:strand:+ start:6754 stop:7227 length:474 start_codon:yes stop_codon:yes gene_type:complete
MEEYDEEELLDETEDQFEQGLDLQEGQIDQFEAATVPQLKEQDSLYNWFWRVVRLDKPFKLAKVGNLNSQEIGDHIISMRDAMNLAHLGHIFKHKTFGNYFATRAKIISATSMAKGGWFMDLSISQKKVRERKKPSATQQQKWRLFKNRNKSTATED